MSDRGRGQSGQAHGQGQQKLHTIVNATTGESRQISQSEWRATRTTLRQSGWYRPDDDEVEAAEGGTGTTGEAGTDTGGAAQGGGTTAL